MQRKEDTLKITLKAARVNAGLTQKEVAEKIGISPQSYNYWENNIEDIPLSKVKIVAEAIGVDWVDIFLP